jgi:hypothetical protein
MRSPPPLITGNILIQLGVTPGPSFKHWLESLYDRQLDGELRTPDQALQAAKKLIAKA